MMTASPARTYRHDTDLGHLTFFNPSELRAFVEPFAVEVVAQPFIPQLLFGTSRLGRLATRVVTQVWRPERWAATVDLAARKQETP